MVKRIRVSDETFEKIKLLKKHFKSIEQYRASSDPRNLSHRHSNGQFNRDYMIKKAVESFLDDSGIEYEK